jgi:hypothetical protein
MALRDDVPAILDYVQNQSQIITHNAELFDIYEGFLIDHVLKDLKKQLSPQTFDQIQHRVSPINVLRRVIDKLAKIYAEPPVRWIEIDSEKDKDLFDWYQSELDVNTNFQIANEFFNLFKNTALEPFVKDGQPKLRELPSDRFTVYSNDPVDPTCPTHFIKFMGKKKIRNSSGNYEIRDIFFIYTDAEFLPVDSKGDVQQDILNATGNPLGLNPIGKIPFIYINRSRHAIVPPPDTDTLRMTKIFPVIMSDLNLAVMYQSFSILYGIDVDDDNLVMTPNAFWRFKSDVSSNSKPSIGSIKPQVDITQVIGFISAQLAFWLQSKNIRPGSVGQISNENFSSGVSKIVDDMDTYEERQKQIPYFRQAEKEFWDLLINYMHPYWVRENLVAEKRLFDPGQSVDVEFPKQRPMQEKMSLINELEKQINLKLTTRRDAIMALNPNMSEVDVDEYQKQIEQEYTVEVGNVETDHIHSTPFGSTSVQIATPTGHYHTYKGGQTNEEPDVDGHIHSLANGEESGPKEVVNGS